MATVVGQITIRVSLESRGIELNRDTGVVLVVIRQNPTFGVTVVLLPSVGELGRPFTVPDLFKQQLDGGVFTDTG